jgi:hypothetical protein
MAEPEFSLITANATNTQKIRGGLRIAPGAETVGLSRAFSEGFDDASAMGWSSGSDNASHHPTGT